MRPLGMADEDWHIAMADLFDTLRKLSPVHKAQAYGVFQTGARRACLDHATR